jgi:hypothetical protein
MLQKTLPQKIIASDKFASGDVSGAILDGYRQTDDELLRLCDAENWTDGATGVVGLLVGDKLYTCKTLSCGFFTVFCFESSLDCTVRISMRWRFRVGRIDRWRCAVSFVQTQADSALPNEHELSLLEVIGKKRTNERD